MNQTDINEAGLDVVKTENLYNARRRERLFGVILNVAIMNDEGRGFGFVLFIILKMTCPLITFKLSFSL